MANDLKILREFVELDSETTTNLRLNEATYYGKDKLLLACEDEIQKIMNKVRKNPSSFLNGECDPHFKKIEGLIKRRFNFEHVSFNTGTASIILNATDPGSIGSPGYTYPNSMLVKYQKNKDGKRCAVVLDKNGKMKLRDGSGMSFTTYIAGSNFYDYGKEYTLTAEELMAI